MCTTNDGVIANIQVLKCMYWLGNTYQACKCLIILIKHYGIHTYVAELTYVACALWVYMCYDQHMYNTCMFRSWTCTYINLYNMWWLSNIHMIHVSVHILMIIKHSQNVSVHIWMIIKHSRHDACACSYHVAYMFQLITPM